MTILSLESALIIVLAALIITLDFKVWAKIDRVVAFMIMEREELLKKIDGILTRIEEVEKRIQK